MRLWISNGLYKGTPADAAVTDGGRQGGIHNNFLQWQEKNTSDFRNTLKYLEMVCMYERKESTRDAPKKKKGNKINQGAWARVEGRSV